MKETPVTHSVKSLDEVPAPKVIGTGQLVLYASVFNSVDKVGDRVDPHAFDATLDLWRASKERIPVVFSHLWESVPDIIGSADPKNVTPDDFGLLAKCDLDTTNPNSVRILAMARSNVKLGASFAYEALSEKKQDDGSNLLQALDLIELGPCLRGAHPDAGVVDVKAVERGKNLRAVADIEAFVREKAGTQCPRCGSYRPVPVHGESNPSCGRCGTLARLADIEHFIAGAA
jgi:HK97 family phage prohead protease